MERFAFIRVIRDQVLSDLEAPWIVVRRYKSWARPPSYRRWAGTFTSLSHFAAARLKQSVSRWPYSKIPLPEFCKACKGMGIAAIDLLQPEDWPVVRDAGLVCSMGYPTKRNDFIPTGFNDPANHAMLLARAGGDDPPRREGGRA